MTHKSGFVGVVGEPNVGKSTLINRLVGQKVAIISPKPQTTRNRLLAILSEPEHQIIFIDTPGILKKRRNKLDEFMDDECLAAFSAEVDVLLLIISVDYLPKSGVIEGIIAKAPKNSTVFLLINKVDLIKKEKLLNLINQYKMVDRIAEIFPISALTGDNVNNLLQEIIKDLPEGPAYYPDDILSDVTERFVIQEIVREKIFRLLTKEVPYCIAVKTEAVKERSNGMYFVQAVIYVEHDSQKAIIIGKNGTMLKKIGKLSRPDIELMLGASVYLDLWVKVEKNWRKEPKGLRKLGYKTK